MPSTSNAFYVDLYNLGLVALSDIPGIAQRFALANQKIAGASNDQGSFAEATSQYVPGAGHTTQATTSSPVYAYWDALRDEFQNILAETATNMYDSAQGVLEIMKNYAATDQAAQQQLEAMQAQDKAEPKRAPKYHDISSRPNVTKAN